jgi:hypothetical protein
MDDLELGFPHAFDLVKVSFSLSSLSVFMVYCGECYMVNLLHVTLFLLETLGGIISPYPPPHFIHLVC